MTDENDITVNDIAVVIWNAMANGATVLEISKAVAKIVNNKWYGSRKDVCENIIGDMFGMNEEEWVDYYHLINIGFSAEEAENAVRGERELEDEML